MCHWESQGLWLTCIDTILPQTQIKPEISRLSVKFFKILFNIKMLHKQNILVPRIQEMLKEICNPLTQSHLLDDSSYLIRATSWARKLGVTSDYFSSVKSVPHQSTRPTDSNSQNVIYLASSSVFASTPSFKVLWHFSPEL